MCQSMYGCLGNIGIGTGPAGLILARPLYFLGKKGIAILENQVINRIASVTFRWVRFIISYYNGY